MAAARAGVRVGALIGLDKEARRARELRLLRRAGVDVRAVPLRRGPVFDNREGHDGRVQIAHAASDRLPADALPAGWRSAACYVLNPVAGEIDDEWADALPAEALVALGWQGLFRVLVAGEPVAALPLCPGALLRRADVNVVSAEDALGGGAALLELLPRDGQQLVVSDGARPALHLARAGGRLRARVLPVDPAVDPPAPTGAGDVLLGTWAAATAELRRRGADDQPWRTLALALAAARAKVEAVQLDEMADLREMCRRLGHAD